MEWCKSEDQLNSLVQFSQVSHKLKSLNSSLIISRGRVYSKKYQVRSIALPCGVARWTWSSSKTCPSTLVVQRSSPAPDWRWQSRVLSFTLCSPPSRSVTAAGSPWSSSSLQRIRTSTVSRSSLKGRDGQSSQVSKSVLIKNLTLIVANLI